MRRASNRHQLAYLEYCADLFAPGGMNGFYMIAMQCPEDNPDWIRGVPGAMERDLPISILGEIMDHVVREYPIDKERIGLIGFGAGADAMWTFSEKHPGRIAAMVPCTETIPETVGSANLKPAIWLFHINRNPSQYSYPVTLLAAFTGKTNKDGGNIYGEEYTPFDENLWSYPLREMKALGWLLLQDRDGTGPPQGVVCDHRTGTRQMIMFAVPLCILVFFCLFSFRSKRRDSP